MNLEKGVIYVKRLFLLLSHLSGPGLYNTTPLKWWWRSKCFKYTNKKPILFVTIHEDRYIAIKVTYFTENFGYTFYSYGP